MQSIELQPDVNYEKPRAAIFPPNRLQPVASIDNSELRARIGWTSALDAHLSAQRIARAQTCRAIFIDHDVITPFNSYKGVLSPKHCGDWVSCPYCASHSVAETHANVEDHTRAIHDVGQAGITEFSFVFSLPGWLAQISVPGCEVAETFGVPCRTAKPCRACFSRRNAAATAYKEEKAVVDAVRGAVDATLPKHGGWWFRAVEPIDGVNGRIAIRFTLLVVDREFTRHAATLSTPTDATDAVRSAYQAALEALGGTDHGSAARAWAPERLEALLRPLALRLQRMVADGDTPMPGTVARWLRASGLTQVLADGRSRRHVQSGVWGAMATQQKRNLALLGIVKDTAEIVPAERRYNDTWRATFWGGGMVRLQSQSTGEFRAELAGIANRPGVDSQGRPTSKKLVRWVRDPKSVSMLNPSDAVQQRPRLSESESRVEISTEIQAAMPTEAEQFDEMRDACLRRGVFGWSKVEWEEVPEAPHADPTVHVVPPKQARRDLGNRRTAFMSLALVEYWAARSRAGWNIAPMINDVAGVRADSGNISENYFAGATDYSWIGLDVDAQKALDNGTLGGTVADVQAQLVAWGIPVDHVVATGSGGGHIMIRLAAPGEHKLTYVVARRLTKGLQGIAKVDPKFAVGSLWRLPGVINWKSGEPRMARVVWQAAQPVAVSIAELITRLDAAGIQEQAEQPVVNIAAYAPTPEDADILTWLDSDTRKWIGGEYRLREDESSSEKTWAICRDLKSLGVAPADAIAFISRQPCAQTLKRFRKSVAKEVGDAYAKPGVSR